MLFSIITPSFRQLDWLGLCAASIADQGVDFEHLVQDAGSVGVEDWMKSHPGVKVTVEPDNGMYDAINRGLKRARGEICAYLNCDEQYLPGTLRKVGDYFNQHPEVDVVFGDAILADAELRPLAYRRAVTPLRWHTLLRPLGVLTCSTFFRRKVVDDGVLFDPSWKIMGDKAWIFQLLDRGYPTAVVPEPLAVFAFTGANLSHLQAGLEERRRWERDFSPGFRLLRPLAHLHHIWRKWQAGAYRFFTEDLRYYQWGKPDHRTVFTHLKLGSSWPRQAPRSDDPPAEGNR
jgi:glycosyltransferase involved in cell wall biosynthesis